MIPMTPPTTFTWRGVTYRFVCDPAHEADGARQKDGYLVCERCGAALERVQRG